MRPDQDPRGTVDDLLELYAIDALEPHEVQLFETALLSLTTPDRVVAVESIRQTRDAVGRMAVEVAVEPAGHVRARILDAIDADGVVSGPAPLRSVSDPISPSASVELPLGDAGLDAAPTDELSARRVNRRRRIALSVTSAAAAVLLIVGGVFIGRSMVTDSTPDKPAIAQTDTFDQLRTVMSASDAEMHRTKLTGIPGTVVVASSRSMDRAVVLLDEAPQPPTARVYQLWLIGNDHAPRPAGLIDAEGTTKPAIVTNLAGSRTVGMTVEPTGGSTQPTGEVLAAVTI